ncbi:hypothetical protein C8Q74DRAFT_414368 [Fomes fomentarius]|nr:hypothetical protein C8Q74DRAFT_414368 [Fomes fomentarius]
MVVRWRFAWSFVTSALSPGTSMTTANDEPQDHIRRGIGQDVSIFIAPHMLRLSSVLLPTLALLLEARSPLPIPDRYDIRGNSTGRPGLL